MEKGNTIRTPPKGLAVLALVGPGLVWCSEMIGSGEVILSTRVGAILGTGVMWAVVLGIFLKYWIGMSGGWYTTCTGEGMIDMFDRIPGPRHWVVWIVLVVQFLSATISIGSLASAAGVFLNSLIPISPYFGGWIASIFALVVVWSGGFRILKMVMGLFVLVMVLGVLYVALTLSPGFSKILEGFLFKIPSVPAWAASQAGVGQNPWREILPLMGWAAGGFASHVWYTYWVLGAGYGAAAGRGYGKPADTTFLKNLDRSSAQDIKGWCRVVLADASVAMIITIVVTISFLIAGAVVLGSSKLAPEGPQVAITLSTIFSSRWGTVGGFVFLVTGATALIGTLTVQLAGWPRLLADAFRICIPGFQQKLAWKAQFRLFLIFFFVTNVTIVLAFGREPVFLVKTGAICDGLLLTPLQAVWVAVGLFVVMPKLFSREIYAVLKPHWSVVLFLLLGFLVFGYFCVFQIPYVLSG
jgi:Mn2+/Fe2+ NRAMP family transporter